MLVLVPNSFELIKLNLIISYNLGLNIIALKK